MVLFKLIKPIKRVMKMVKSLNIMNMMMNQEKMIMNHVMVMVVDLVGIIIMSIIILITLFMEKQKSQPMMNHTLKLIVELNQLS